MLINSCGKCDEDGFLTDSYGFRSVPCECLLKARAKSRLLESGFKKKAIDIVSGNYDLPEIEESDIKYVEYVLKNPLKFEEKGLGLYLYSEDRGRGKTTLAHHICYSACKYFFDPSVYHSDRTFSFLHIEDFLAALKSDSDSWKATWLVIDDMGNEDSSSEWKRSANLALLQKAFHYRRDANLPIIITSNKPPEAISMFYQGVMDSLLEISPGGKLGGVSYRSVKVLGAIDLRFNNELDRWENEL